MKQRRNAGPWVLLALLVGAMSTAPFLLADIEMSMSAGIAGSTLLLLSAAIAVIALASALRQQPDRAQLPVRVIASTPTRKR